MRGEERNNSLLRSMRIHIAEWEAGRATPEGSRFMFIWLAMYLGTAWPALAYCQPLLALGFLVIWFFPSQWICRRIVPRYNESWAEVFDRKLSDYEPLNLPAWEHLKHQAETEGLTVSIVSNWYQEEARSVWPEKKPDLKFLHKTTDRRGKTGEE
ncbi:TPA: hypothetical protein OMS78_003989 [Enterobacter hormaechei]|uniref:hypothetical protein n=1 Tax=Enterobacteriaceae TaxID=543 RepID=UPI00044A30BB|nr:MULTISPECIES: hypothetical protein [Enterobacter]AYA14822.1 hypothetical protein AM452_26040 [Enterobacter cloacae]EKU5186575.1 hypothetical protein [Klebsiella oxytoca]ELC3361992.1 hypothetical protein [Escherichia coli]MCU3033164.1 hypothetical protein [Enterobacter hormaechei subsp. hoffmannii]MDU1246925.1 hypothetical protein [Veillonella sp.]MDU2940115.1 hypothetical protein [Enterobacteriaceae bacterium]HBM7656856.1 hypothetical protein [Enterobacter cloacae subsp. cloacae]HED15780